MAETAAAPPSHLPADPKRTLLHTAWLAVALGFLVEIVLLLVAATGGSLQSLTPFVADLVQKVSWSTIVCVGLAFGKAVSRASPGLTGLAGLLAAPAGFTVARALHKGAGSALGIAGATVASPSPFLIAGIKAIQYLCLGALASWLVRRGRATLGQHLLVGLASGAVFGGLILVLMVAAAGPGGLSGTALVTRAVNEFLFPTGCAAVLYATDVLGKKAASTPPSAPPVGPAPPRA